MTHHERTIARIVSSKSANENIEEQILDEDTFWKNWGHYLKKAKELKN